MALEAALRVKAVEPQDGEPDVVLTVETSERRLDKGRAAWESPSPRVRALFCSNLRLLLNAASRGPSGPSPVADRVPSPAPSSSMNGVVKRCRPFTRIVLNGYPDAFAVVIPSF